MADRRGEAVQGAPVALDFGSGSGCIALALAKHVPSLAVDALDASPETLVVARENARDWGWPTASDSWKATAWARLNPEEDQDLIVSKPPYIPTAQIDELDPEVREHDPLLALDGGPDGLRVFRLLAGGAAAFLRPGGRFMAEFGDGQAPAVMQLFAEQRWVVDEIVNDLSGRARIVIAHAMES